MVRGERHDGDADGDEVTASTVYDVTVSGGNLADRNAPVTLTFAAGQDIVDTADNALSFDYGRQHQADGDDHGVPMTGRLHGDDHLRATGSWWATSRWATARLVLHGV